MLMHNLHEHVALPLHDNFSMRGAVQHRSTAFHVFEFDTSTTPLDTLGIIS